MNAEWGSSRWNDSKGMMKLESHKPDERRMELYERVKRHNEYTSGLPAREQIQFIKDLDTWVTTNGYSLEELKQMKVSIRL